MRKPDVALLQRCNQQNRMKRIQKLVLEVQQIAQERGHKSVNVRYAGRSLEKRGEHAVISCTSCSAVASVRSKPYPDECDIEGTLTKTSCNVATPNLTQGCLLSEVFPYNVNLQDYPR
jgi:hypothetical protein